MSLFSTAVCRAQSRPSPDFSELWAQPSCRVFVCQHPSQVIQAFGLVHPSALIHMLALQAHKQTFLISQMSPQYSSQAPPSAVRRHPCGYCLRISPRTVYTGKTRAMGALTAVLSVFVGAFQTQFCLRAFQTQNKPQAAWRRDGIKCGCSSGDRVTCLVGKLR